MDRVTVTWDVFTVYVCLLQLTNHPWQSMRDRYLKKILPNIDKFDLSAEQKQLLKRTSDGANGMTLNEIYDGIHIVDEMMWQPVCQVQVINTAMCFLYKTKIIILMDIIVHYQQRCITHAPFTITSSCPNVLPLSDLSLLVTRPTL